MRVYFLLISVGTYIRDVYQAFRKSGKTRVFFNTFPVGTVGRYLRIEVKYYITYVGRYPPTDSALSPFLASPDTSELNLGYSKSFSKYFIFYYKYC